MKTVSVILTTYNSGKYLQQVLDSILQQDGVGKAFTIQLIAVDDCSTDDTLSILAHNHITSLSTGKNSGGPNRGRNIGLDQVRGDYICITDHDDIWQPHRLLTLLPHLASAPIATSGYTVFHSSTSVTQRRINKQCTVSSAVLMFEKNATFKTVLAKSHGGQTAYLGSIVYDASLKHIRFEELYGVVDFDWIVSLFYNQRSVEVCDTLYTRYVDHSNLSLNARYRQIDFEYGLSTIDTYRNEFPAIASTAYRRIHGSKARYHYVMGEMKEARHYFRKAGITPKHVLYYLTTYAGSSFVKKHFNVFG